MPASVLPDPLGPSHPTQRPGITWKEMSLTAAVEPKRFETPSSVMIGSAKVAGLYQDFDG
jgi:hypothetical protein